MASNFKTSVAARNAACGAVTALIDAAPGPGQALIYSGAPPAIGAAATGTLLATINLAAQSFSPPTGGSAFLNGAGTASVATGTAGYFRFQNSAGTVVMQGTVGESADNADLTVNVKDFIAGGSFAVISSTLTVPE